MTGVRAITIPFVLNFAVNCYVVPAEGGLILIDTGAGARRRHLERELEDAGCRPGDLRLIILTHGDFDHLGNAAYLRQRFGAPIAMHRGDLGFATQGDMYWNRKSGSAIMKALSRLLFRLKPADRFEPDAYLEEGTDLSAYGLEARVLSLSGHSAGSIALLTADGDLFCGDLLGNTGQPGLWRIMDDREAATVSLARLQELPVTTVYPGHGKPFSGEQLRRIGTT